MIIKHMVGGVAAVLMALAAGATAHGQASGSESIKGLPPAALTAMPEVEVGKVVADTVKSLVLVEYTYRNENASQESVGQGLVLNKEGVVLISGGLIPESLPKEYLKDLKVRVPGKRFTTVPAVFLGRTVNRLFAFVKTEKPLDAPPLDISRAAATKLGQQVFSVAFAGKGGGYEPYTGISRVKAVMHMSHDLAVTQTFGLTRATSPVFDLHTGALVGVTFPALEETMLMRMEGRMGMVSLKDDDQSAAFLPWGEVEPLFKNVPDQPFDARRPWLGIDGLTGLEEGLGEVYGIAEQAGVTIGAVIPAGAAEKAGLQGRDVILTLDGKTFSDSPVPDYMVSHFQRKIERMKIGQEVKLGILRDGKKMDVMLTLGASPRIAADMPHVFNPKLGITTRDLVFGDTYSRKLPADQKGVVVALVKQGAVAGLGAAPLRQGYLITRINDQDVENQQQFADLLKAAADGDVEKKDVVFRVIRQDGETQMCRVDLSK